MIVPTAKECVKNKSCLSEEKENTGIRFSEPETNFAIRHAMTNSSSKQQQLLLQQQQQHSNTRRAAPAIAVAATLFMHEDMLGIFVAQYNTSGPTGRGTRV